MDSGTRPRQRVPHLLLPHRRCHKFFRQPSSSPPVLPWIAVNSSNRSVPVWDNILLRTTLYYLALLVALYGLNSTSVGGLGLILSDTGFEALAVGVSKSEALTSSTTGGPAALPTLVAMASAFLFALPVAWIYILTRQKKGYSQSVVQSLLVLPIVIAGIVVLVKHSLPLAFSLAGIVAAVRFRTNLDDTKDAAAIFCVTGIGLAAAVQPGVAAVLSVCFNALAVGLWATEFGRSPASLEGKRAQRQLERALTAAGRTGTFVAKMDDEVLKSLAPEQLEALADRAWKRKKKMASEEPETIRHEHQHLLRVLCRDLEMTRALIENEFGGLFSQWKYVGAARTEDGARFAEYGVDLAGTVTRGVVSDVLRAIPGAGVERVEIR